MAAPFVMRLAPSSVRAQVPTLPSPIERVPELATYADLALFARAGVQAIRLTRLPRTEALDSLIARLASQALIALRSVKSQESADGPENASRRIVGPADGPSVANTGCVAAMKKLAERQVPDLATLVECARALRELAERNRSELTNMEQKYFEERGIRSI
jgi:hypothetical protein